MNPLFQNASDLQRGIRRGLRAWVLLLGLFCFSGQQALESAHAHAADDVAGFCQLCSSHSDTAVNPRSPGPAVSPGGLAIKSPGQANAVARPTFAFQSRGPPLNS